MIAPYRKVLVTGGSGYIGSVLVPRLADGWNAVLSYDLELFGGPPKGATYAVRGDIRRPLVDPSWPDVVVHLAGLSNDPMGDLDPRITEGINLWGTREFIRSYPNARHVVISSCAVYGQASELCREDTEPNPQTLYAECKARVDEYVTSNVADATILRLGTVYGPSPNPRLDLVVNRMTYDSIKKQTIHANGDAARPLTHISDVAWAIEMAVAGDLMPGIYNVVGENIRIRDLAETVRAPGDVVFLQPSSGDTRDYMASGDKIARAGFTPGWTVERALPSLRPEIAALGDDPKLYTRLEALKPQLDGLRQRPL